jgi:hypothetical protein
MVDARIIRVPLDYYTVRGVDQPLVRPLLSLSLRVGPRGYEDMRFIVDSATPLTTIPVLRAAKAGLVIPQRVIDLELMTATGKARQKRHPGRIQGRIMGLPGWEFDWPCHFSEHQDPGPWPQIGPVGVIDDFRLSLEGSYALEAPHGWLIVERLR